MINALIDQLEPPVSDEEDDGPDVEFTFRATAAAPESGAACQPADCRAVIVCGAGAAAAYALSALAPTPVPWTLEAQDTAGRVFPPPPKSPRFYTVGGQGAAHVALAVLDGPVPGDFTNAWTEVLLDAFAGAQDIVFLDRIFRAGWRVVRPKAHQEALPDAERIAKGLERPQEPYLCGVWTAACGPDGPLESDERLPQLPSTNALEGVPAALLTRCEASCRRCLVALALQDGVHLAEGTVSAFEALAPLFRRLGALHADSKAPDYREAVRAVVPPPSLSIYA